MSIFRNQRKSRKAAAQSARLSKPVIEALCAFDGEDIDGLKRFIDAVEQSSFSPDAMAQLKQSVADAASSLQPNQTKEVFI